MIRTGMILAARYEVIEQIGSGGMAYVYKARDRKLNRLVAIKVLKEEFCKDKSFVAKFRMEAQAAAGLSHNNIVSVFDVGEENSIHFIVMELIDGITLKDYIIRKRKLGMKETIGIAIQVAQGLEVAHNHHIVHRDIKPQNIIISRDGRIKVTDFGIARAITDETTNLYGAAGSVHYISPEQARGGYCDERSDIYSLGITIYEMVTGRVPFDGDTTIAVAIAHINEAMVPPSNIEASVPIALEQIIYKCTQKRPQQRYSSCADLIKDLKHAIVAPNERFVHFVQVNEAAGNETVVMDEKQINDIRRQAGTPEKKEPAVSIFASGAKSTALKNNAEKQQPVKKQQTPVREQVPAKREMPEKKHRRPIQGKPVKTEPAASTEKENSLFDRMLVILGSSLGIIMLVMLIYIVGSLSGAFIKKNPASTDKKTAAETAPEDTMASVYESIEGETLQAERTEVPNVLGKSIEDATKLLKKNDLKINVSRVFEYSDEYEAGLICKQQYKAGSIVDKDTLVKVYVSVGTDKFEINSKAYVGENVTILNYYLKGITDIDVEYIEKYSNDYPKDTVMYLEPQSGFIGKGDTLKVYVSLGPEFVEVPQLLGLTPEAAKVEIEKAGLVLGNISESNSNDYAPGLICAQSEIPNASIKSGATVSLAVSIGPVMVAVPGVVGTNLDAYAAPTISAAKLYYRLETASDPSVPAGSVISQNPVADAVVPEYSTVTLLVSSGPDTIPLDPAALNNMPQAQAESTVSSMNLTYSIQTENSTTVAPGCVIRWTPVNGSDVLHPGDTVYIVVSAGPPEVPPAETPASDTPAAPAP